MAGTQEIIPSTFVSCKFYYNRTCNTSFPLPRWCQAEFVILQTVMLIDLFQTRVVGMPAATGRIEPNSRTLFGLNGQSGPSTSTDPALQDALDSLRGEVLNFAQRFIQDKSVREDYVAQAEKVSQEILEGVEKGELTPAEAAGQARAMRNGLLDSARLKNSDIGRAVSEAEKSSGLTMEELLAKYSKQLFQKDFAALGTAEQDAVFLEVVRAAGRPNPRFTGLATRTLELPARAC